MRFMIRALNGFAMIALCLGLLGWGAAPYLGCVDALAELPGVSCAGRDDGAAERGPRERTFEVRVATLEPTTAQPEVRAFGEVLSGRTLEIRAPAGGELVDIAPRFRDGERVSAGQLLFRVDPADPIGARLDAEAAVAEAEAELAEAGQAVSLAEAEYQSALGQRRLQASALERRRGLAASGYASTQDIDAAELALADAERAVITRDQARAAAGRRLAQAEQQRRRAEIALEIAERDVEDTAFRAPFDGLLEGVDATLGRWVAINEQLGALIDPAALEVGFRVADADFARLLTEDGALAALEAEVSLDLGPRVVRVPATLDRASARVTADGGGRLIYAHIEGAEAIGSGALFRPGDFVEVRIVEPPMGNIAMVPSRAVDGAGRILVVGADDRLEEVAVTVVRRQGDVILIADAPFGRAMVLERTPQLGSGIKVRPTDGTQAGGAEAVQAGAPRTAVQR